ncbi:IclR family transcriptional regulator [Natronolimnohabitans sp. A-GB9]|uniref:IclR family transcriptional regulator n=1 Tax=Natronolimnohabitans sp. A-GB9 TaxID=3069757 RepID=UPI0027B4BA48|nr:IclR family transcriptional regulator [Natronolimnohabitans sp. A-GB9]MDQ2052691.1 IclR family transcriptional regulator [Natronolimnohabitans sp. A-GB9]
MPGNPDQTVKSADTLFGVLQAVHELGGSGATEVAEELGIAKSTTHNHLTTLVEHEFLIKEGSTYRVGLKCLHYGIQAKSRIELAEIVKPSLEQMAGETDEIAWFMVEEYGKGVYLEKAMGERAVQPYGEIGKRVPLQNIAAGKAILAHLPEEQVHDIVTEQSLSQRTENTLTDPDELLEELELIRERGYALNDGETFEGFRAVASPIVEDGEPLGSIVVSGPENRLRDERFTTELPEIVTGAANAIELSLASR